MERKWKLQQVDERLVEAAAVCTHLPLPLARALVLRGHHTQEALERFLQPLLAGLSDPFLLPDAERAADRIWRAVDRGEPVTVFGDYDVDGVSSTALLTRVLTELGARVNAFIPDRMEEGYGLSREALDRCIENLETTLLITVDCGTNSVQSVSHAGSLGIDVIVTDHHEPEADTAAALALINPKRLGREQQHLQSLAGVGVAFKLAHALLKTGRAQGRASAERVQLQNYLDLVALGTVSDLVPLTHENRILVRHGLDRMEKSAWPGLRALREVAGLQGRPDSFQLGFQLGPRINAAGRIGRPMQALRLLTTDDPKEARRIAVLLNRTNRERRRLERDMAEEAIGEVDRYFDPVEHFGLVVARPGWHPGVIGIVASRVARRYNRPAVVIGIDDDGRARGSCRSIDEFDVLEGLRNCEEHLTKYGGHTMAAGIELPAEAIGAFHTAFNAAAASMLHAADLSPLQRIDAVLEGGEIDRDFYAQLAALHPFGQDNPEPVWALSAVRIRETPRVVGDHHLRLCLAAAEHTFEAIAFNYSPDQLPDGLLDIAFTLKENRWNGRTNLQLNVKDIRPSRPL